MFQWHRVISCFIEKAPLRKVFDHLLKSVEDMSQPYRMNSQSTWYTAITVSELRVEGARVRAVMDISQYVLDIINSDSLK